MGLLQLDPRRKRYFQPEMMSLGAGHVAQFPPLGKL
jgi:hypothetical protein